MCNIQCSERNFYIKVEKPIFGILFSIFGFYIKEFPFMNSKIFQPIYINFVREPVQRIISWYYYIRAPWYQVNY